MPPISAKSGRVRKKSFATSSRTSPRKLSSFAMATAAQANKISVTAAVDELVAPDVHLVHVPPVVATAFDRGIVKVPPWFDSSTNILTQAGRPTFYRQFCLSPPVAVRTMTVVERSQ